MQLVLASDRKETYAMYIYGDQKINWAKTSQVEKLKVLIGYTIKGGLYYNVNSYSFSDLALEMDKYAETSGKRST